MRKVCKVLMLVENAPVPGDQRVWNEATALRDHGYQVSIICPKSAHHQEAHVCNDNIHIYRYSSPTKGDGWSHYILEYSVALLMMFWLSLIVLFRHGFDVIHVANPPDVFFILGLLYRPFGKKFVFDLHDLTPELFRVKFEGRMKVFYKLQAFLEWCSCQTAHLVIVTNLSQKQVVMERNKCPPHKVFVVRNGPDLKRIKLVTPEPILKKGRQYLLAYVGIMEIQDGVDYVLYALHNLIHKYGRQDVSLVLMGEGNQVAQLTELAYKLQLDEYITFTGWIDSKDLVRYLTVTDIALCPDPKNGLNETCTMVKTMEYMAMGKPVVAFDLTETRFSAQDAALYAVPNDVEDFAGKIAMLLDDEQLRLRLGAIGRKRIEEELHWGQVKKQLVLAYETLFPPDYEPLVQSDTLHKSEKLISIP